MENNQHSGSAANNDAPKPDVKSDVWAAVTISKATMRTSQWVRRRRQNGICVWCAKPNDRGTARCAECTAKVVASNEVAKKERRAKGLCVVCAKPWTGQTKLCAACKNTTNRKWAEKRKLNPLKCIACDSPRDTRGDRCVECREGQRLTAIANRKKKRDAGFCICCGKTEPLKGAKFCLRCQLMAMARTATGSSKNWKEFLRMYQFQGCKCAYTGEAIFIGGNASIDHIMPIAKGGKMAIENCQWVTWKVNQSKNAMTHDEFLAMCTVISSRNTQLRMLLGLPVS